LLFNSNGEADRAFEQTKPVRCPRCGLDAKIDFYLGWLGGNDGMKAETIGLFHTGPDYCGDIAARMWKHQHGEDVIPMDFVLRGRGVSDKFKRMFEEHPEYEQHREVILFWIGVGDRLHMMQEKLNPEWDYGCSSIDSDGKVYASERFVKWKKVREQLAAYC